MGYPVIIYGKSGSGKSRSLKNFAEDEILFCNVENKAQPFRHGFKYTVGAEHSHDVEYIKRCLSKMPTKTAVIDDAGYLMTDIFMRTKRSELKGNEAFELYNKIAEGMWSLIRFIKNSLPEDAIVYLMLHEDTNDFGATKLKTIGKLLDDKVCLEGMVTICLRCMSEDGRHFFRTVTSGYDITKAPEDMFEAAEIDNDLKAVDTAIREYYGFNKKEETK